MNDDTEIADLVRRLHDLGRAQVTLLRRALAALDRPPAAPGRACEHCSVNPSCGELAQGDYRAQVCIPCVATAFTSPNLVFRRRAA